MNEITIVEYFSTLVRHLIQLTIQYYLQNYGIRGVAGSCQQQTATVNNIMSAPLLIHVVFHRDLFLNQYLPAIYK